MLLTAGTLQNRKCTFVNVIERFAVYNTVSITDCLILKVLSQLVASKIIV